MSLKTAKDSGVPPGAGMSNNQGKKQAGTNDVPRIRPARAHDAERLLAIIESVFRDYDMIFHAPDEVPDLLDIERSYFGPGTDLYTLELDGQAVGCGAVAFQGETATLSRIYIDRTCRRRGFGRRLVEHLIDRARHQGATAVDLWSDTRFTPAHRLYQALGFRATGAVRPLADVNESHEYHYELKL